VVRLHKCGEGVNVSQNQNFENHARFVPLFHFVVAPIFLLNIVWSIVRVIRQVSFESVVSLLVAVALFLLALTARLMALTVQDRVIRLEMRLRMQEQLPPELRARIHEFTVDQMISLRFASDAELPSLAQRVLDEKLTNRTAIKKLVRDWQPDFLRA
jgi:dolichyl-phosphate-mannose--protein O-mannosyl transferase